VNQTTKLQKVEGFERVIAGKALEMPEYMTDFRGQVRGWIGDLWWEVGTNPTKQDLTWETAPCPERADTLFSFAGATAMMPYGFEQANKARLLVNGEYALTFDLGVEASGDYWDPETGFCWKEGEFRLTFRPKRVQTPFEGYHRQFDMSGISGIYRLTVPARLIEPGEGVKLRVALEPPVVDCITWFVILDRRDTLQTTMDTLVQEMRVLQQDNVRLKDMVNVLAKKAYPELFPDSLSREHVVVYGNGRRWVGVPDILKLHNGELLLTIRESSEHVSNDGAICTLRSSDGGRTWGDYRVVVATPGTDHRDASVTQLRNESLIMTWFPQYAYDEETGVATGWREGAKGERGPNLVHVLHSFDNGHTWAQEAVIPSGPFLWHQTVEPCIELPSGRIIMPLYAENRDGHLVSACFYSDDQGYTWEYLSTILTRPESDPSEIEYLETSMAMTGSGKLLAISRTERDGMWQASSEDMGHTWNTPHRLAAMPSNMQPSLTRLSDGRLLLSYGHRKTMPRSIRVQISQDEGETWSPSLVLRDDFPNRDLGYACSVELESGRILTIYWYNLFGRFFIGGTFWSVPPAT